MTDPIWKDKVVGPSGVPDPLTSVEEAQEEPVMTKGERRALVDRLNAAEVAGRVEDAP